MATVNRQVKVTINGYGVRLSWLCTILKYSVRCTLRRRHARVSSSRRANRSSYDKLRKTVIMCCRGIRVTPEIIVLPSGTLSKIPDLENLITAAGLLSAFNKSIKTTAVGGLLRLRRIELARAANKRPVCHCRAYLLT